MTIPADIDIEKFIPHRDRIRLLDGVLEIAEDSAVTTATVKSTWPLCDGREINSLILVETVAQTAALIEGHKRNKQGKTGAKGWLVGIKNAEFNVARISVDTRLVISVSSKYSFDNYGVVEGIVKSGEKVVATMILQALRMNDDNEGIFEGGKKNE
jgi:predicted hotdog family 3-hydroxylacyl-ACP dehydratase